MTCGVFAVEAFGPTADGVTDDTAVVQAALNAATGKRLVFPAGKTLLVYGLKVGAETTIDLNGCTLKKRAVDIGDSDNLQAFTGSAYYYGAGSLRYPPMFYLLGNAYFYGNGGTLDGNFSNETRIWPTTAALGGSHRNDGDRNGIMGSVQANPRLARVHVSGVRFKNFYSQSINLDGVADELIIQDCTEEGGRGVGFSASGGHEGLSSSLGTLIFKNNKMQGTRQYNFVPNDFLLSSFATVQMIGNVIDGRNKVNSLANPRNAPDCGKLQSCTDALIQGNIFYDSGVKLASYGSFVGQTFTAQGNSFILPAAGLLNNGGIGGGGCLYNNVAVTGNTFLNCGIKAIENAPGSLVVASNTFTADVQNPLGGNGEACFLTFPVNRGQTPSGPVISGNTFNLGGFDGHVALTFPHSLGFCLFEGNTVQGVDHFFYALANGTDRSQDHFICRNNSFTNYRTIGRWRFASIAAVVVENNFFGASSNASPSIIQGYSARDFRVHFDSGAGTWGLLAFIGNIVNDPNHNMRVGNDTSAGATITTFICENNKFLSEARGNSVFSMQNGAAVAVPFVSMRNNIAKHHMNLSSNWTTTRQITDSNIFMDNGDRIFNSQGNAGLTGARSATVGAAGGAAPLPAAPDGYLVIDADGGPRKVPFYRV